MDLFDHAAANRTPFTIEKGIPVASNRGPKRHRRLKKPDFPFGQMEVGDSFAVSRADVENAELIVVQNMVSGAASTWCSNYKGPGKPKFTTRQMRGDTVRCWRTA